MRYELTDYDNDPPAKRRAEPYRGQPVTLGHMRARMKGLSMRSSIWIGIPIGSTVGGMIPLIWGDDMLSYSSVLLSGAGVFAGCGLDLKRPPENHSSADPERVGRRPVKHSSEAEIALNPGEKSAR
jgi:hypothetical protein